MANILLYVQLDSKAARLDPYLQDGDILCAMSDEKILQQNAWTICQYSQAPRNSSGNIAAGSLCEEFLKRTRQYLFERVSRTQVRRTNLWNVAVDILNLTRFYIAHQQKRPDHFIFGDTGQEYWFGGRTRRTLRLVNEIWREIESQTAHRKADNNEWKFSDQEKKSYLAMPAGAMDDSVAVDTQAEDDSFDGNGEPFTYRARQRSIDWRSLSINEARVKDPDVMVDVLRGPAVSRMDRKRALSRDEQNAILRRHRRPLI